MLKKSVNERTQQISATNMNPKIRIEFTPRESFVEYFNLEELPIGELSYSAIQKALRHEMFFRKFYPTFCRENLMQGHKAALLYWYPFYVNELCILASEGNDAMSYFKGISWDVVGYFEYLFPETVSKLKKIQKLNSKLNHLEETVL